MKLRAAFGGSILFQLFTYFFCFALFVLLRLGSFVAQVGHEPGHELCLLSARMMGTGSHTCLGLTLVNGRASVTPEDHEGHPQSSLEAVWAGLDSWPGREGREGR